MATIEQLYQQYFGRAPDAGGLAYWTQKAAAGEDIAQSIADIAQQYAASTPEQAAQTWDTSITSTGYTPQQVAQVTPPAPSTPSPGAAPQQSGTGTVAQPTATNAPAGLRWDDLYNEVTRATQKNAEGENVSLLDAGRGQYQSSLLGGRTAQVYREPDGSVSVRYQDPNGPDGYMTALTQSPDGSVNRQTYKQEDGFLKDMALLALAATGMGYGINALGGAGAGAGATGGAGGGISSGGGSIGASASGGGSLGTGLQTVGGTGFQAGGTGLGLTTAGASPGALGTLGAGSFGAETLGGLAALTPAIGGSAAAITDAMGTLAPGSFAAETIGGLAPLTPGVMAPNTTYLGSLGEGSFAAETLAGLPPGYTPTFPSTLPPVTTPGGAPTPTPAGTTPPGATPPPTTSTPTPPIKTITDILTSPLTATIAGATLGGSGGSQQGGKTTTTVEPWEAQQPYLKDLYANAQGIFNANKTPSANEVSALDAIQQRAMAGSPLQTAAKSNIQNLLGQDPTQAYGIGQTNQYMGQNINVGSNPMLGLNNPYLQSAIDSAQQDVTRAMQPQFQSAQRSSGSFGNSGLQETYARELPKALGTISNNMRMQDYGAQQQLQESALNRSVAAQQADLGRNSTLAQQGIQNNIGQFNNMLGLQTDAAYRAPGLAAADYNDPQMAYNTAFGARQNAFMPLQQYQSAIGGNVGSSTSSPYFTNPAANMLGGATAGLGLWNAAQKSGLFGGGDGGLSSWFGNNQNVANTTGLGWSDLLGAF